MITSGRPRFHGTVIYDFDSKKLFEGGYNAFLRDLNKNLLDRPDSFATNARPNRPDGQPNPLGPIPPILLVSVASEDHQDLLDLAARHEVSVMADVPVYSGDVHFLAALGQMLQKLEIQFHAEEEAKMAWHALPQAIIHFLRHDRFQPRPTYNPPPLPLTEASGALLESDPGLH